MDFKRVLKLNRIVLGFIILILIASALAIYNQRTNTKGKSSLSMPADWTTFKSDQYGFRFSYPKSWGKAKLSTNKDIGGVARYSIVFTPAKPTEISKSISVNMDSSDCKNVCVTKDSVKKNIAAGKTAFVKYTNNSYAWINSSTESKTNTLTEVMVVDIPKIKVTAAAVFYTLNNGNNCPQNKFAVDSKDSCITVKDYDTVMQVLQSIEAI